ncbi:MAG: hypothetical protein E3K32_05275 [wastewater metagenome]|nr:hypothetical protein [Candidatus Loosdrechtia aerotolerans]
MSGGMWLLPVSNKLFFTFFLSFMAIAIGIGFLNYYERTGFSPQKTARYYKGDEEDVDMSLPAEEYQARLMEEGMFFPKSYRELLEVTHTHAFSMPLIVFVLSRILAMTRAHEGIKITVYSASFAAVLMNLGASWLIRYACHHFVAILFVSNITLILTFGVYIFIPLYEMWFKRDHTRMVG